MKKLILIILLLFSLSTTVYAHSGGTDSQGGHYENGDYHYHHGYSAHDHYDMDGDGDVDCPYDFKDNTITKPNRNGSDSGKSDDSKSNTEYDTSIIGRAPTFHYEEEPVVVIRKPSADADSIPTIPTVDSSSTNPTATTRSTVLIIILICMGAFLMFLVIMRFF